MFRLSAVLVGALLLTGGPAHAQKARYSRTQEVKVDVKLSDRVKPSAPKTDLPKAAPEVTADQVLSIEGQVGDIRKEQVQILDDLIEESFRAVSAAQAGLGAPSATAYTPHPVVGFR